MSGSDDRSGVRSLKSLTGVLVVDKPTGMTSHDVVAQARRLFGQRSVGHAGTLDPMATGVLLLLFGEATKLSFYLAGDDKSYQALVRFGTTTDTLDADGRVIAERPIAPGELSDERIAQALMLEQNRTEQIPPAVSALKVGGTAAYRLSRQGKAVELAPRPIRVNALDLLAHGDDWARLALRVSKGYYVRSLARDLGERLGMPAHLAELRRTASGAFTLQETVTWPPASVPALLSAATAAARSLPMVELTDEGAERARHGKKLEPTHFASDPAVHTEQRTCAWIDRTGRLIAVGRFEQGSYAVVRGFREE